MMVMTTADHLFSSQLLVQSACPSSSANEGPACAVITPWYDEQYRGKSYHCHCSQDGPKILHVLGSRPRPQLALASSSSSSHLDFLTAGVALRFIVPAARRPPPGLPAVMRIANHLTPA